MSKFDKHVDFTFVDLQHVSSAISKKNGDTNAEPSDGKCVL